MNHIIFYLNSRWKTAGPPELLREVDSAKKIGFLYEFSFFLNENNVIQISFRFKGPEESPIVGFYASIMNRTCRTCAEVDSTQICG